MTISTHLYVITQLLLKECSLSMNSELSSVGGPLGPAYDEFRYNEHPATTSSFLCIVKKAHEWARVLNLVLNV